MTRKFEWFDTLRFVAILLVIFAHSGDWFEGAPSALYTILDYVQKSAWLGVDLFFVLSGFLVSGLLFDEYNAKGSLDIKRFLIRRGFKIIPAFYVLTGITFLYDAWILHQISLVHLPHDILFIQSYRVGAWTHSWTLAVEVHFYCLLALLVGWLSSSRPGAKGFSKLPIILGTVMIFSFLARWITAEFHGPFNFHKEIAPTHLHLDVLSAGVLLRYLFTYRAASLHFLKSWRVPSSIVALLFVSMSGLLFEPHSPLITALLPTLNAVGFSILLFQFTQLPFPKSGWIGVMLRPIDFFGSHSYSIYLWHLAAKEWIVAPWFPHPNALSFLCFVGSSLILGTLFSIILEHPILLLRNRLFPSKSSIPQAQATPATI